MAVSALRLALSGDVGRLASLSRDAKLTYRMWAPRGWQPPSLDAELVRWERRLRDPAGWTIVALAADRVLGAVHLTDARMGRGQGQAIAARAHLSGLFVEPSRWGEGIGSRLLSAAFAETRSRGYESVELFTAAANRRSRTFYEARGWGLGDAAPP